LNHDPPERGPAGFRGCRGGVLAAWAGVTYNFWLPAGVALALLLGGLTALVLGRQSLPDDPERAIAFFECSLLTDLTLGAAFSACLIWLAVQLEPGKEASVESSKLLAAALGALSGFLTTLFIEGARDADEGWVGRGFTGSSDVPTGSGS